MRLLFFSDLHLEARFAWAPPEVGRARRDALRACLRRIIALADELGVDALCCGGDLYEHDRHRPDTGAFLREIFGALAPTPIYLAPGNHDWLGPGGIYADVRWSGNVHVFTRERLTPVPLTEGLTLWGAGHRSPTNTRGFLDGFRVGRDGVHVALFHGAEQSGVLIEPPEKLRHAPFRAEQIAAAGLQHALVGHFHTPREAPDHTYPGNPEPLTFGETGRRGAVLVTLGPGGVVSRQWHTVAVSEVHDVTVALDGATHAEAIQDRVDDALAGLSGIARVTLTGEVGLDVQVDPARLRRPAALDAWVVRVGELRYGYDVAALADEQTVRGQFVRDVQADPSLSEDVRRRVLLTGLRALDGRDDLAVP
ncbi:MAG TPA: metallophosphoesterase [Micromonosporaceae bacterium]|jgi:DNA repair exonuclease SbcCD nuclease subunit